jgi:DNA-binding Xre family transcriptional regulator
MYHVDINKLNGKIAEKSTTKEALANEIGIDRTTFLRRLKQNRLQVGDAHKICEVLSLSKSEAVDIFLATQSQ